MKILRGVVLLILATIPVEAQNWTSESLHQGALDLGLYAGGGTGLVQASQRYRTADIRFLGRAIASGMLYFHTVGSGQAQPHPLQAFELT